jgi:hypothetical protein
MKLLFRSLLFFFLVGNAFLSCDMARRSCDIIQCKASNCGCNLIKKGWNEIARCEGHNWRYVIEKEGNRLMCIGVDERGGQVEEECTNFTGDLDKFKACN